MEQVNINSEYTFKIDLVVGMQYCDEGIQPCHNGCKSVCVNSSDKMCPLCIDVIEISLPKDMGTKFYIVMCVGKVKCEYHDL